MDIKQALRDTLQCQNVTYRDVIRSALSEIERLEKEVALRDRVHAAGQAWSTSSISGDQVERAVCAFERLVAALERPRSFG